MDHWFVRAIHDLQIAQAICPVQKVQSDLSWEIQELSEWASSSDSAYIHAGCEVQLVKNRSDQGSAELCNARSSHFRRT